MIRQKIAQQFTAVITEIRLKSAHTIFTCLFYDVLYTHLEPHLIDHRHRLVRSGQCFMHSYCNKILAQPLKRNTETQIEIQITLKN